MRILIAEDDRVSALVLRKTLEKSGYEVHTAGNGREAWEALCQRHYPVIISDWMMPEMDGAELCRRLRSRQGDEYVYVILLTAKDRREDRLAGLKAGADDFLIKPPDTAELLARLEVAHRILAMQTEIRERSRQVERMHDELEEQNGQLEEAMSFLQAAHHRYAELFEGLPVACYSCDGDGAIHEWNRAAVNMFGYEAHEAVTHLFWEVVRPVSIHDKRGSIGHAKEILRRIIAGQSMVGVEFQSSTKEGRRLHVLCNIFPIRLPDGSISGAISAIIDITRRKELESQLAEQLARANGLNMKLEKANARLEDLATTDGLTGLKNHRHFREQLEAGYSYAVRHQAAISVVMLDVDHFKQYNDTFGHPAGDEVLRMVADSLCEQTRQYDLVARYGGEEFVVLLPGTDQAGSLEAAERMRTAIERQPWTLRPITASFGVATLSAATAGPSALVDQADRALYASKAGGRNRVTHFTALSGSSLLPLAG